MQGIFCRYRSYDLIQQGCADDDVEDQQTELLECPLLTEGKREPYRDTCLWQQAQADPVCKVRRRPGIAGSKRGSCNFSQRPGKKVEKNQWQVGGESIQIKMGAGNSKKQQIDGFFKGMDGIEETPGTRTAEKTCGEPQAEDG